MDQCVYYNNWVVHTFYNVPSSGMNTTNKSTAWNSTWGPASLKTMVDLEIDYNPRVGSKLGSMT